MAINCFVAMAIGQVDTDRLFLKGIRPALKSLGIDAQRVDNVEHNNNIDLQILRMLGQCELAVVDLTYARPSVYFEAGFAESRVPVVYTCREDHFKERDEDVWGNLRVHFDLKMRNIISWKTPTDRAFQKRLLARMRKVISPIVRRREEDAARKSEQKAFAALSVAAQVDRLSLASAEFMEGVGMKRLRPAPVKKDNPLFFWSRQGDCANIVSMWVLPHATAKDVNDVLQIHNALLFGLHIFQSDLLPKNIAQARTRTIICSPGSVLDTKFRRSLTQASPLEGNVLEWQESQRLEKGKPEISTLVQYESVAKVMSPRQLVEHLRESLTKGGFVESTA